MTGKAIVKYVPTTLTQIEIRKKISKDGFEALIVGDQFEDTESIARQQGRDMMLRHVISLS